MKKTPIADERKIRMTRINSSVVSSLKKGMLTPPSIPSPKVSPKPSPLLSVGNCSKVVTISKLERI
jgi:hypothetical protein